MGNRVPLSQYTGDKHASESTATKPGRVPLEQYTSVSQEPQSPIKQTATQMGGAFKDAGTETYRGYLEGQANLFKGLDSLSRITGKMTGAQSGGAFGAIANEMDRSAQSLPSTNMGGAGKLTYNMIGQAAPATGEFLLTKKGLNSLGLSRGATALFGRTPATESLSDAAVLGVTQAIQEYRKNGSIQDSVGKLAEGASLGLAFPIAIDQGKKFGKGAAYTFVKFVTGNEQLAKDFSENPLHYNLFTKTPSSQEVGEANKQAIIQKERAFNETLTAQRITNQEKKAQIATVQRDNLFSMRQKNKEAQQLMGRQSAGRIEQVSKESAEAYGNVVNSTKTDLLDSFTASTRKLDLLKKQEGDEVGQAVENLLNRDPFTTIRTNEYLKGVGEVADKFGYRIELSGGLMDPYKGWVAPKGRILPKHGFSAADKETMQVLQENIDDILAVSSKNGVPLGFAQERKKFLQNIAYSGEQSTGNNARKVLASKLDPSRLAPEAFVGKDISGDLAQLRKSNEKFSTLIPRYEEAQKLYTRPDAQGNPVPDFTRAINAVKNSDKTTIRQMQKADLALAPEDRLLPKVQEAVQKMDMARAQQMSNVKLAKRKATELTQRLTSEIRVKEQQLKAAQTNQKLDLARKLEKDVFQLKTVEREKLDSVIRNMNEEEQFLKNNEDIKSFFGGGRAGNLQTAGVIGLLSNFSFPDPVRAGVSAALTAVPSPRVGGLAIQGASLLNKLVGNASRPLGSQRALAPALLTKERASSA